METCELLGTRFAFGEAFAQPKPGNDDFPLLPDWMTSAEMMQVIRQERRRLSRKVDTNPLLWRCPKHRAEWINTLALEQCAIWHGHLPGERGGRNQRPRS